MASFWNDLYASVEVGGEDSMEEVRFCLLHGHHYVPLRPTKDVVTVDNEGILTGKPFFELEPEDQIILRAEDYIDYRNRLTDEQLCKEGHPELRQQTEKWKHLLRDAIEISGGAKDFCDWCKEFGLDIPASQYVLNYTTDQVMLPRNLNRFSNLMNACYCVLDLQKDMSDSEKEARINGYWEKTGRLKRARRTIDKTLNNQCEDLVRKQITEAADKDFHQVELDGHILWRIWTIEDIGTETRSVPYSRVEVPRKVELNEQNDSSGCKL